MHWQGCAAYRIHSAILSALSFARHTLMLIWIISGGGRGGGRRRMAQQYFLLRLALPSLGRLRVAAGCGSAQFLTLFLILSALAPLPAPFLQDIPVVSTHCTAADTSSAFQVLAVWCGLSLTYPFCPSHFPCLEALVA